MAMEATEVSHPPPYASAGRMGSVLSWRHILRNAMWMAAPLALLSSSMMLLGEWIIDDAGISFAYARNLAEGHGLVSQPGRVPVEGFSNFLWVLLMAPFFWLDLFDPVVIPKLFGASFVLATLALVRRQLVRSQVPARMANWAIALVAFCPPVVIWSTSGLENGLLLFLGAALWTLLSRGTVRADTAAGVMAGLMALTRPDAMLTAAAALLALWPGRADAAPLRKRWRGTTAFIAGFCAIFGPFFAFRLMYFGRALPHTYTAKRVWASEWEHLTAVLADPSLLWSKWLTLAQGIAGPTGPVVLPVAIVALTAHIWRQRHVDSRAPAVALGLWGLFVAAFLWLDDDWMGELRFATAAAAMGIAILFFSLSLIPWQRFGARATAIGNYAAPAALAALVAFDFAPRTWAFAAHPPTPYEDVRHRIALRFDAYARALELDDASILVADAGATLMDCPMIVYDLAGLFEPNVVHTLKKDSHIWHFDHPEFYDWVLDELRPTFISTNKFWTVVTGFELDPRFCRDYAAIDAFRDEYALRVYGRDLHSGEFVRRDALGRRPLELLRSAYTPAAVRPRLPHRLADAWAWLSADGAALDAQALLQQSQEALDAADTDRAAILAERVTRLRTDDATELLALWQQARALDDGGRTAEARPLWEVLQDRASIQSADRYVQAAQERLTPPPAMAVAARAQEEAEVAQLMQEGVALLYERRMPKEAELRFREVVQRVPTHYGGAYQLAASLDAQGRQGEAIPLWQAVLRMAQDFQDPATAATAEAKLRAYAPDRALPPP